MADRTYSRTVYNRYSRKLGKPGLGSDQWNTDSGTSHAVEAGMTLCGVLVGTIRNGWDRAVYARSADAAFVDCRRCRRTLEAESPTRSEPGDGA